MTTLRLGTRLIDVEQSLIALDRVECEESLASFIRLAWHVIEPAQPYVHNWHIDAICEHLEAISDNTILPDGSLYNRVLFNIPPGTMKSLTVNVFWPAWEWGPCNKPHFRYLCASHNEDHAIRDNTKMRRLVTSEWFQQRWPHVVLTKDQNQKTKFENTATGFRQACAAESLTGARGDRVIIDDPHSVKGAESEAQRQAVVQVFRETVPTRLNNPDRSAIVVVMQRLHDSDVSGVILDNKLGYDHLCLPMRATLWRRDFPTKLGFVDPRTVEGDLLFPARFPAHVVDREEVALGPYAFAGQFQQEPAPRGGGIVKSDWWKVWDSPVFPDCDYIVASLDTAYTEKSENDPSAMTVWGVFHSSQAQESTGWTNAAGRLMNMGDREAMFDEALQVKTQAALGLNGAPKVVMMFAWSERLELHALIEKVAKTCRDCKVDKLLIENKASGISVAQEIQRVFGHENWMVQVVDARGGKRGLDKVARLHSVVHLFAEGMIYAPDKKWAQTVIQQAAVFPKGRHDDLVDTTSMALRHLRDTGMLVRAPEWAADARDALGRSSYSAPPPIYPA